MFEDIPNHIIVSGGGLLVGFLFGLVAFRTQFCIAGSVYAAVGAEDHRGLRAIFLAILTALLFAQLLHTGEYIDLDQSIYRTSTLHWAGGLIGGFAFGYGMILANGCGAGSLVRMGSGDLRSIIVLNFIGIFGYMTLRGLTGMPRVQFQALLDLELKPLGLDVQGIDHLLALLLGSDPGAMRWPIAIVAMLGLAIFVFKDATFRQSPSHIASGILIGVAVSLGWYVTGHIGADEFDPVPIGSLSFVGPVANTLQYGMTFTGATINFGIGTVIGVFLGSLLMALIRREFRFQYVDGDRDLVNAMVGGALMGTGGVFAFGCSIGNGVTGISTLSIGAVLGWTGILFGGFFAARRLLRIDE